MIKAREIRGTLRRTRLFRNSEIELLKLIGKSNFKVFRAKYSAEDGSRSFYVAVKIFDYDSDQVKLEKKDNLQEIITQSKIECQYTTRVYGYIEDYKHHEILPCNIGLVMEICDFDLRTYMTEFIIKNGTKITISQKHKWIHQIVYALNVRFPIKFLYSRYRAKLKRIDNVKGTNYVAKVTDFGLAKVKDNELKTRQVVKSVCGTPGYMAPELLRRVKYNHKVDVFALGLVMWELFAEEVPYKFVYDVNDAILESKTDPAFEIEGGRPIKTDKIPKQYWNLITRCWDYSPKMRPDYPEILDELKEIAVLTTFHRRLILSAQEFEEMYVH